MATRRRIFGSSIYLYLCVVCAAARRFFVVSVRMVVFFGAVLTGVFLAVLAVVLLAGFAVALLVVLAVVLLAVAFTGAFVAAFAAGLVVDLAVLRADRLFAADASINGVVLRAGALARTCLIAFVCSWSVIRNSWCPSRLATK
jgi:hypothetical protein